jgi:hypothetical protein
LGWIARSGSARWSDWAGRHRGCRHRLWRIPIGKAISQSPIRACRKQHWPSLKVTDRAPVSDVPNGFFEGLASGIGLAPCSASIIPTAGFFVGATLGWRFRFLRRIRNQPVSRGVTVAEYLKGMAAGRTDKTIRFARGRMELGPLVKGTTLADDVRSRHPGIMRPVGGCLNKPRVVVDAVSCSKRSRQLRRPERLK